MMPPVTRSTARQVTESAGAANAVVASPVVLFGGAVGTGTVGTKFTAAGPMTAACREGMRQAAGAEPGSAHAWSTVGCPGMRLAGFQAGVPSSRLRPARPTTGPLTTASVMLGH